MEKRYHLEIEAHQKYEQLDTLFDEKNMLRKRYLRYKNKIAVWPHSSSSSVRLKYLFCVNAKFLIRWKYFETLLFIEEHADFECAWIMLFTVPNQLKKVFQIFTHVGWIFS